MMSEIVISARNLTRKFGDKIVVNQVNLDIFAGEIYGFLGPNGSGKTTTIRMLCGLLTPDGGEGTCLGYDIVTEASAIKRNIGYMTQAYSFYRDLTVEENLLFIARVYGLKARHERVLMIMEEHGLVARRKQLTGTLSGGWKQRVALAACLLHKPRLLFLDEPTAGVDPLARREFWARIKALSAEGITTLISTHYMDEAARCSRLSYLAFGDLLVTGTADDIIKLTGEDNLEDAFINLVQQTGGDM